MVMTKQPALFWGVVVSMWIGNLFLLILNLPIIGLWVRLLTVPTVSSTRDSGLLRHRGIQPEQRPIRYLSHGFLRGAGVCLRQTGMRGRTLMLGFILGPMLEEYFRRALLLSKGDPMTFITRPISAVLLAVALVSMFVVMMPAFRRKREEAFRE